MTAPIAEIRKSVTAWNEYHRVNWGDISMKRIEKWGDHYYILLYQSIRLTQEPQRVAVIDVTSLYEQIAKFCGHWPAYNDPDHAIVIQPDEGHMSVVLENGDDIWVYPAELMVRLTPGTRQDMQKLAREMDDEDQASVDAGGTLYPR
jgi:hypothetical protein